MPSPDDVPAVSAAVLEPLQKLGDGGQGSVWATDRVRINGEWRAVFKRYRPVQRVDYEALASMIRYPGVLPHGDGKWLAEHTAWPAAIVTDAGKPCGFLMRRVPDGFQSVIRTTSGESRRIFSSVQLLLNPDPYLTRVGIEISNWDRLRLLEGFAEAITRLHSLGVVVGDLSPTNLLFRLDQEPSVFFVDADGMSLRGTSVLAPVQTVDWEVPTSEPHATQATDRYKFGLLAIRLFAQDQSSVDSSVIAQVSETLGRLAEASLSLDPDARPELADWLATSRSIRESGERPPTYPSVAARTQPVVVPNGRSSGEKQFKHALSDAPTWHYAPIPSLWLFIVVILFVLGILFFR